MLQSLAPSQAQCLREFFAQAGYGAERILRGPLLRDLRVQRGGPASGFFGRLREPSASTLLLAWFYLGEPALLDRRRKQAQFRDPLRSLDNSRLRLQPHQFHESWRHRFARDGLGCHHSLFQPSAIQVQRDRCWVDASPAGRYWLLAAPILPPVLKAGTDFIEGESVD